MEPIILKVILFTIIGMSLVFLSMSMIWLLITVITRIFSEEVSKVNDDYEQKMQAAVISVAIALSENKNTRVRIFPLPDTPLVSAWQAVLRSNILNKRGVRR